MKIFSILRKKASRFISSSRNSSPELYPVKLYSSSKPPIGNMILSYLAYPVHLADSSLELKAHSNAWESREIARIFKKLDFNIDVINWDDRTFIPHKKVDLIFDISVNLQRIAGVVRPSPIKILYRTGSDPNYQNVAETRRVENVNRRRNSSYSPKRLVHEPELEIESLRQADFCLLLGNEHTLNTYPAEFRDKISLVPVSGSYLGKSIKSPSDFVPDDREFLWFFGAGAVHKGLDLLLEVFARNKHLVLNIIGNISNEEDFFQIYEYELNYLSNIKYHGWLIPSSKKFRRIINSTFCFIAPTCSEAISAAAVTCLQAGLYPIISRDTGISLPLDCGVYLETCSINEIERFVHKVHSFPNPFLSSQIHETQKFALVEYSRRRYSEVMSKFILEALVRKGLING